MTIYNPGWTARRELSSGWAAALAGMRDMLPLVVALTPLGLLAGATVAESSVRNDSGLFGGVVMYGASAHITAISLLGAGAGGLAVVAAVVVINARGLVYSAALSTYCQHRPAWFRWGAPYLLVDPLFALVSRRAGSYGGGDDLRAYYLGSGLTLIAAWIPMMVAGVLVGPALPDAEWIDFAIPALFIGFLVPGLAGRSSYVAAGFGGAVALAAMGMPGGIGLIVATVVGAAAGTVAERIGR